MRSNSDTATKTRSRCSWSVEERVEWLRLLDESGQTLPEFCRANDLPESTVSLWRRRQREAESETQQDGEFVEVALPTSALPSSGARTAAPSPAVVIQLPGDRLVEVAAGTDIVWLSALLRAL